MIKASGLASLFALPAMFALSPVLAASKAATKDVAMDVVAPELPGVCDRDDNRKAFGQIVWLDISQDELTKKLALPNLQNAERVSLLIDQGQRHYFNGDRRGKAIPFLEEALRLSPDNLRALYLRACTYSSYNSTPEQLKMAESDFATLVSKSPTTAQFWIDQAEFYDKRLHDTQRTLASYAGAIKAEPNASGAYHQRGYYFVYRKQFADAARDFAKAQEVDKNYHPPDHDLEAYYSQASNLPAVISEFDAALTQTPDAHYVRYQRAILLRRAKRYRDAITDLDQLVTALPSKTLYLNERLLNHYFLGNYEAALADAERSLTLDPLQSETRTYRADTYVKLKQFDKAALDYHSGGSDRPFCYGTCKYVFAGLGPNYQEKVNFDLAKGQYEQRIRNADHAGLFHYNLALLLLYAKPVPYSTIADHIQKAKALGFKTYGLNATYGGVLANLGKMVDAHRALDMALADDWRDKQARAIRVAIYLKQKDYRRAATAFDEAADLEYSGAAYWFLANGCRARLLGRFELQKAAQLCFQATQAVPTLEKLKDWKANPTSFAGYFNISGRAALLINYPERALQHYELALTYDPANTAARYGKAMALQALGRQAEGDTLEIETLEKDPKAREKFEALSLPGDL